MKLKSLTTLALLFVLGFSVVHEFVYIAHENNHCDHSERCSAIEYIHEQNTPSDHGDICDIHFEYHQSYTLSQNTLLADIDYKPKPDTTDKETYNFKTNLKFYKPPIA